MSATPFAFPPAPEFAGTFLKLREVLARHSRNLRVAEDSDSNYSLNTVAPSYRGKPLFFGAVQITKNYVSFHLMPVYVYPELLLGTSNELRRRMQGKSCFNFKTVSDTIFAELDRLTAAGLRKYQDNNLL